MDIIIDMDEILCDLLGSWLDLYNNDYNDNLTISKITEWDIHKFVKPECGVKIYDYLKNGLFRILKPHEPGVEAVAKFIEWKHHVTIATKASSLKEYQDKLGWLQDFMPFLEKGHSSIFFSKDKSKINGDLFIDDSPTNIITMRDKHPDIVILTISYPYNQVASPYANVMFDSYKDMPRAWSKIENEVKEFQNRYWKVIKGQKI